jgi:hypothetical protein
MVRGARILGAEFSLLTVSVHKERPKTPVNYFCTSECAWEARSPDRESARKAKPQQRR